VQAADQGWNGGESGELGLSDVKMTGITGTTRVQAWVYDSVNKGKLAPRIQKLMSMSKLLDDWYFPWALLRVEGILDDVLVELVKVSYSVLAFER
jgi:hypothetical protein